MLVLLLNSVTLFTTYSVSTTERQRIQSGDHKVRRSPLLKRMLRILYCWGELLCDARTWLWWGEKFPITVFCLQQGLNWIYAQCWNLRLQIWIMPKGGFTHLCHSRVISSHVLQWFYVLNVNMRFVANTSQWLARCFGFWERTTPFVREPSQCRQFPLSCLEGICLRLLDNKSKGWGTATTYE